MDVTSQTVLLSPVIRSKLVAVRRRWLAVGMVEALIIGVVVLLIAMLSAIGIDWLFTLSNIWGRIFLTTAALLVTGAMFGRRALHTIITRSRLVSAAMEVDRVLPEFRERLSTVTELTQSKDPPEVRGSARMLWQTMLDTENLSHRILAPAIAPWRTLRRKFIQLVVLAAIFMSLFLMAPDHIALLLRRFWSPASPITLTTIHSLVGTRTVPKGEPLTLAARTEGIPRSSAELIIKGPHQTRQLKLVPSSDSPDLFSYAIPSVNEPFDYRFSSGDGQSPWFRINPVDRPALAEVQFRIMPPAYSKLPIDASDKLPRYARALKGSELQIEMSPTKPLAAFQLVHTDDRVEHIEPSAGEKYEYKRVLQDNVDFSVHLVDRHGLSNIAPPRCRLIVYKDKPPTVEIRSPDQALVVPPDDKVKIAFKAYDDLGIARAELLVRVADEGEFPTWTDGKPVTDGDEGWKSVPISLGEQQGTRMVRASAELDLKSLGVKNGQELSYMIRVTDTGAASTASDATSPRTGSEKDPSETHQSANQDADASAQQQEAAQGKASQQMGSQGKAGQEKASQGNQSKASQSKACLGKGCQKKGCNGKACQGASKKPKLSKKNTRGESAQRPPNDMTSRQLNVGGGSACSGKRRIKVDEWSGSFTGQARRKLQLAIESYFKRLKTSLVDAQKNTDSPLKHLRDVQPWSPEQRSQIVEAKRHLTEGEAVIAELKNASAGSPYAFMGLQLDDIGASHVVPAKQQLTEAGVDNLPLNERIEPIDQASFHIASALRLLDNLTRQYEATKKELDREETVKQLAKMHQLFIEDMQILLGACKPLLNKRKGKWRIIPDELAAKILEMVENRWQDKKALLDALAKILADDPDLLRRFMAMTRKEARTIRDQLTVLANGQQELNHTLNYLAESKTDYWQVAVEQMWARLVREQEELAQKAAQLYDNTVTWKPRQPGQEQQQIAQCIEEADKLARLARHVHSRLAIGDANLAYETIERELVPMAESLQDKFASADSGQESNPILLRYLAWRLRETNELISRQVDWLDKVKALEQGKSHLGVAIEQRRLTNDTGVYSDKISRLASNLKHGLTESIGEKADDLTNILTDEIVPTQIDTADVLVENDLVASTKSMRQTVDSFAKAEKTFDDLLTMIEEYCANKPISLPSGNEPPPLSLEDKLAKLLDALEEERDACEKLGALVFSNISIQGDWSGAGSGSGFGLGIGNGQGGSQGSSQGGRQSSMQGNQQRNGQDSQRQGSGLQARLRAAMARAKAGRGNAKRLLDAVEAEQDKNANRRFMANSVENRKGEPSSGGSGSATDGWAVGATPEARNWDVLVSTLGDALRQGHGTVPPEQYRAAIDAYFRNVPTKLNAERSAGADKAD